MPVSQGLPWESIVIRKYHSNLKKEFFSFPCQKIFKCLQETHPVFKRYRTLEEIQQLCSIGNKQYLDQNKILGILVTTYHSQPQIFPLLNLIFWELLLRLYNHWKNYWPTRNDLQEFFQVIQTSFLETLSRYYPQKPYCKVGVNIYLNTKNRVYRWRGKLMRRKELSNHLAGDLPGAADVSRIESQGTSPEEIDAHLLKCMYQGVISKKQYEVLVETVIFKRMNLKQWAEQTKTSSSQVRSLKKRAIKYLLLYQNEKKFRKK